MLLNNESIKGFNTSQNRGKALFFGEELVKVASLEEGWGDKIPWQTGFSGKDFSSTQGNSFFRLRREIDNYEVNYKPPIYQNPLNLGVSPLGIPPVEGEVKDISFSGFLSTLEQEINNQQNDLILRVSDQGNYLPPDSFQSDNNTSTINIEGQGTNKVYVVNTAYDNFHVKSDKPVRFFNVKLKIDNLSFVDCREISFVNCDLTFSNCVFYNIKSSLSLVNSNFRFVNCIFVNDDEPWQPAISIDNSTSNNLDNLTQIFIHCTVSDIYQLSKLPDLESSVELFSDYNKSNKNTLVGEISSNEVWELDHASQTWNQISFSGNEIKGIGYVNNGAYVISSNNLYYSDDLVNVSLSPVTGISQTQYDDCTPSPKYDRYGNSISSNFDLFGLKGNKIYRIDLSTPESQEFSDFNDNLPVSLTANDYIVASESGFLYLLSPTDLRFISFDLESDTFSLIEESNFVSLYNYLPFILKKKYQTYQMKFFSDSFPQSYRFRSSPNNNVITFGSKKITSFVNSVIKDCYTTSPFPEEIPEWLSNNFSSDFSGLSYSNTPPTSPSIVSNYNFTDLDIGDGVLLTVKPQSSSPVVDQADPNTTLDALNSFELESDTLFKSIYFDINQDNDSNLDSGAIELGSNQFSDSPPLNLDEFLYSSSSGNYRKSYVSYIYPPFSLGQGGMFQYDYDSQPLFSDVKNNSPYFFQNLKGTFGLKFDGVDDCLWLQYPDNFSGGFQLFFSALPDINTSSLQPVFQTGNLAIGAEGVGENRSYTTRQVNMGNSTTWKRVYFDFFNNDTVQTVSVKIDENSNNNLNLSQLPYNGAFGTLTNPFIHSNMICIGRDLAGNYPKSGDIFKGILYEWGISDFSSSTSLTSVDEQKLINLNFLFWKSTFIGLMKYVSPETFRVYFLEKLLPDYGSSLFKVRRDSDDVEKEISIGDDGKPDSTEMSNFVGSDIGYLVSIFEQSGNGSPLSVTTKDKQPKIFENGSFLGFPDLSEFILSLPNDDFYSLFVVQEYGVEFVYNYKQISNFDLKWVQKVKGFVIYKSSDITQNFGNKFVNELDSKYSFTSSPYDWSKVNGISSIYGLSESERPKEFNINYIPNDLDLSNLKKGRGMFNGNKITSLPENLDLSSLELARSMFKDTNLTSLPTNLDLSSLVYAWGMFQGCNLTSLPENLELPVLENGFFMFKGNNFTSLPDNFQLPSSLNTVTGMFYGCDLTSLPDNLDLSMITDGNIMFYSNDLISLPKNIDLSNLKKAKNMFNANELSSLPTNLDLSSLEDGSNMFGGNELTSLPENLDLSNLERGVEMFSSNKLASLPENLDLSSLDEGFGMFSSNSLTSLPLNLNLINLTSGSKMFRNNSLSSIPAFDLSSLGSGEDMFMDNNLSSLPSNLDISNLTDASGFLRRNSFTSFPTNVDFSTVVNANSMLDGNELTTVPDNLDTLLPNANNIKKLFGYNNIDTIPTGFTYPPNVGGDNESLELLFAGNELTSIPSDFDFSIVVKGQGMFKENKLTSLPSTIDLTNLKYGEQMFQKNELTSLPSTLELPSLQNGKEMFAIDYYNNQNSGNLSSLPSNIGFPSLVNGEKMFQFQNLTTLPSSLDLSSLENGDGMFENNDFTSLPSSLDLSSLEKGNSMFGDCKLTSIPNLNLSNLKQAEGMFAGNELGTLPDNLDLNSLENGTQMFSNNKLTSLPSNLNLISLKNGSFMFEMNQISSIPNDLTLSSLEQATDMFRNCNLSSFPSQFDLSNLINGDGMFQSNNFNTLPSINLPNLKYGGEMFYNCGITSVPDDLDFPSLEDAVWMFYNNVLDVTSVENLLATFFMQYQSVGIPLPDIRMELDSNFSVSDIDDSRVRNLITSPPRNFSGTLPTKSILEYLYDEGYTDLIYQYTP